MSMISLIGFVWPIVWQKWLPILRTVRLSIGEGVLCVSLVFTCFRQVVLAIVIEVILKLVEDVLNLYLIVKYLRSGVHR